MQCTSAMMLCFSPLLPYSSRHITPLLYCCALWSHFKSASSNVLHSENDWIFFSLVHTVGTNECKQKNHGNRRTGCITTIDVSLPVSRTMVGRHQSSNGNCSTSSHLNYNFSFTFSSLYNFIVLEREADHHTHTENIYISCSASCSRDKIVGIRLYALLQQVRVSLNAM